MDLMINVIIPAIQIIVFLMISLTLFFILIRFGLRYWKQRLKFFLRYSIFRKKYDEEIIKECYDAIDKNWRLVDLRMHLLKNDFLYDDIFEILYVYEKMRNELNIKDIVKGGIKRR